uniref:Uncharacterized protein n=1 Tax=Anguilla anguilla TaxID=7936 RepID=A0A0E9WNW0_ANGAN
MVAAHGRVFCIDLTVAHLNESRKRALAVTKAKVCFHLCDSEVNKT